MAAMDEASMAGAQEPLPDSRSADYWTVAVTSPRPVAYTSRKSSRSKRGVQFSNPSVIDKALPLPPRFPD
ncbi:hypothetical protein [Pseudomonas savastanoi]|uniref:hypothetical protein n=1 Tax=Pseudomonas savastanoi TaxID=29438 RepID=UPI0013C2CD67|nr:hypothetical protein [Pseudomonas savastanoi]